MNVDWKWLIIGILTALFILPMLPFVKSIPVVGGKIG